MRYLIDAVTEAYLSGDDSHIAFGWKIERKAAGMNGLIYKAQSDNSQQKPLAIKISQRDDRQRTIREYTAMNTLIRMGLNYIVPTPIVFHEEPENLPGDVLVMEWLAGETLQAPPSFDDKRLWRKILVNFADIHTVMPIPQIKLFPSALSVIHPIDLLNAIKKRREPLPQSGEMGLITVETMDKLLDNATKQIPPSWENEPATVFVQGDANPMNIIVQDGRVKFVDWANSGWSDGAFDIADMLVQPAYVELADDHKAWICQTYADIVEDESVIERIKLYEKLLYLFWVYNFSRYFVGAGPTRIAGVKEYPRVHYEKFQKIYCELAQASFG